MALYAFRRLREREAAAVTAAAFSSSPATDASDAPATRDTPEAEAPASRRRTRKPNATPLTRDSAAP